MGSTLVDTLGSRGTVWADPELVCSDRCLDELLLTSDGGRDQDSTLRLEAKDLAPFLYDPLIEALKFIALAPVETFPYDWRLPISTSALGLTSLLQEFLGESPGRRVAIAAHSMGGLVVAQALSGLGSLARRVVGVAGFGVPWLGSYEAALNLRGEGSYVRLFAELTFRKMETLTDVIQTFWGLTDLLPRDPAVLDPMLYRNGPLGSSPDAGTRLERAIDLIRTLNVPLLPIVGRARDTPEAVTRSGVALLPQMGPGDGIVPYASAISGSTLDPVVVNQNHIMLPIDPIGIVRTVLQIGTWLTGSPYSVPPGLPLRSAHQLLAPGFSGVLNSGLTWSPLPDVAWRSVLHHW
jgi:pimeloyl-ACP methyl ester carboxylesterase